MADALKLLLEQSSKGSSNNSSYSNSSSYSNTLSFGLSSTILSVVARAILIILVIILILVIIHYTVKPIFKIKSDEPGIISLPSLNPEDKVFWKKKSDVSPLNVKDTPIGSSTSGTGFSLSLDIQIDDAHNYTGLPRLLFYKGGSLIEQSEKANATVSSMITDASIVFALTRDTNDLQVSVITTGGNIEGVLLYNIPLRKPFRIGIIVSDKRLEVYTNGLLSRTRTLTAPPKPIGGSFWPSPTSGVQLRNLHIWPTVVSSIEMRTALPAIDNSIFDVSSLQETSNAVCPTL